MTKKLKIHLNIEFKIVAVIFLEETLFRQISVFSKLQLNSKWKRVKFEFLTFLINIVDIIQSYFKYLSFLTDYVNILIRNKWLKTLNSFLWNATRKIFGVFKVVSNCRWFYRFL